MHLPSFAAAAAFLVSNAITIAAAPQNGYPPLEEAPVDRKRQSRYRPLDYPPLEGGPADRKRQSRYRPIDYPPLSKPEHTHRQLGYRPLSTLTGKTDVDKYFDVASAASPTPFEFVKVDLSSVDKSAAKLASFQPPNEAKRIIGDDGRELVISREFPYRSIGRVIWNNGDVCTGALVGDRLVLTAKHCLDLHKDEGPLFQPGFDEDDESFGTWPAKTAYYLSDTEGACEVKDDWAVVVLTEPIGTYYGYFGIQLLKKEKLDEASLIQAGYPVDLDDGLKQYQQQGVAALSGFEELKCDAEGPVFTDADVAAGQAGSPIWDSDVTNGPALFGVLVAEWESGDKKVTAVATGSDLVATVEKLRKEFPL